MLSLVRHISHTSSLTDMTHVTTETVCYTLHLSLYDNVYLVPGSDIDHYNNMQEDQEKNLCITAFTIRGQERDIYFISIPYLYQL